MVGQVARMRTINGCIKEINLIDPNSEFKTYALRQLIKSGQIKSVKMGTKYLVDIDYVMEFLRNPPREVSEPISEYGKLRKIKL